MHEAACGVGHPTWLWQVAQFLEGLAQVTAASASGLTPTAPVVAQPLEFVAYDDMCHLKPYLENRSGFSPGYQVPACPIAQPQPHMPDACNVCM